MRVISPTPGNVEQVTEMKELISLLQHHKILNLPKFTLLHKTFNVARFAMADRLILNHTNTELLAVNT